MHGRRQAMWLVVLTALTLACAPTQGASEQDVPAEPIPAGEGRVANCVALTCGDQYACGQISDGCGGVLDCGTCADGAACDHRGTFGSRCAGETCRPWTCAELNQWCGTVPDGCGGALDCGDCSGGCVPLTCEQLGATCGVHLDGCGGQLRCGACGEGEVCGAVPNQCAAADTTARLAWVTALGPDFQVGALVLGADGAILVGGGRHALRYLSPDGQLLAQHRPGMSSDRIALNPATQQLALAGFDPNAAGTYGGGVIEILEVSASEPLWRLETGDSTGIVGIGFGAQQRLGYLMHSIVASHLFVQDASGRQLLQIGNEGAHPYGFVGRPTVGDWVLSFHTYGSLSYRGQPIAMAKGELVLAVGGDGALKWARPLPSQGGGGHQLAVSPRGELALVGAASSRGDWGPRVGERLASGGYLVRLGVGGEVLWVRDLPSSSVGPVALNDRGETVVVAQRNGCEGLTVMTFAPDGTAQWRHVLNPVRCGEGELTATGVALTPDGDVILSGRMRGQVELGGRTFLPDDVEGFVLRLNAR